MPNIPNKKNIPHWILHTHYVDGDEYECSVCCRRYKNYSPMCPGCKSVMDKNVVKTLEWVEEAEKWDMYLEDL